MKLNINCFSRKLGAILVIIFLQSSLGTNCALKDFSNVTTKDLGQNGYYKLPDGLLIQWGYGGGYSGATNYFFLRLFLTLTIQYQCVQNMPLLLNPSFYALILTLKLLLISKVV